MNKIDANVLSEMVKMDDMKQNVEFIIRSANEAKVLAIRLSAADMSSTMARNMDAARKSKIKTIVQTIVTMHHMAYARLRKGFLLMINHNDLNECESLIDEMLMDFASIGLNDHCFQKEA